MGLFEDMFGEDAAARRQREFRDVIDSVFSSEPPAVKKCADARELADWFRQFGRACRAALPKEKS